MYAPRLLMRLRPTKSDGSFSLGFSLHLATSAIFSLLSLTVFQFLVGPVRAQNSTTAKNAPAVDAPTERTTFAKFRACMIWAAPGIEATQPDQLRQLQAKIAFIDSDAFWDETVGIARLIKTEQAVEREHVGSHPTQAIDGEIRYRKELLQRRTGEQQLSLAADPQLIILNQQHDRAIADAKARFNSRIAQATAPIKTDIDRALGEYASANRIDLLLDLSCSRDSLLSIPLGADLTDQFVRGFNGGSYGQQSVPAMRIAVVDTGAFFDPRKGLLPIVQLLRFPENQPRDGESAADHHERLMRGHEELRGEITTAIAEYAKQRSIILFDANKADFTSIWPDLSHDFIDNFNQHVLLRSTEPEK